MGLRSCPPAAAAALPGSADWRYLRSRMLYRDDTPPSRDDTPPSFCGGNAPVRDDSLAASPSCSQTSRTAASPREPSPQAELRASCAAPREPIRLGSGPSCTASVPVRLGSGLAFPQRCRRTDWPLGPKQAPKTRVRRPPPHRSKDDVSSLRSSLDPQLDMVRRLAWLPFGRSPLPYPSDGILNRFCESAVLIYCWPESLRPGVPSVRAGIEEPDCKRGVSYRLS